MHQLSLTIGFLFRFGSGGVSSSILIALTGQAMEHILQPLHSASSGLAKYSEGIKSI